MNFTDGAFLVFFFAVFAAYYLVRVPAGQLFVLVAGSVVFYAWESIPLLGVFACSWLITGLTSFGVASASSRRYAKCFAIIGVLANLGLLAFFKYKFLWISGLADLAPQKQPTFGEWLVLAPLPIGISFYTFHGISLLVDVYRKGDAIFNKNGERKLGRHLANTLLYLVFFPQLIAGPIIKAKDFFPQLGLKRFSDIDFSGCFRILVLGFFLKSVVADNLAEQTAWMAYPYFQRKTSFELLLLLYGYSAQIFADFAGYSLIAIGLAKLLGYKLPENFNFPYLSSSISEFWRRWHISLSSWLRDYLYIPLGGSKKGVIFTYANLITVMFLGGLWHGAAWSFAIWGLWHGLGLVLERPWLQTNFMTGTHPFVIGLRVFLVFNFVSFGWLFFKLQDFSHAGSYLYHMVSNPARGGSMLSAFLVITYSGTVFAYHFAHAYISTISIVARTAAYGVMLFLIVTNSGPSAPFIYFQF